MLEFWIAYLGTKNRVSSLSTRSALSIVTFLTNFWNKNLILLAANIILKGDKNAFYDESLLEKTLLKW